MCYNYMLTFRKHCWKTDTRGDASHFLASRSSVLNSCRLIPVPVPALTVLQLRLETCWDEACPAGWLPQPFAILSTPLSRSCLILTLEVVHSLFPHAAFLSCVAHLWPPPCCHIPIQLPGCHPCTVARRMWWSSPKLSMLSLLTYFGAILPEDFHRVASRESNPYMYQFQRKAKKKEAVFPNLLEDKQIMPCLPF